MDAGGGSVDGRVVSCIVKLSFFAGTCVHIFCRKRKKHQHMGAVAVHTSFDQHGGFLLEQVGESSSSRPDLEEERVKEENGVWEGKGWRKGEGRRVAGVEVLGRVFWSGGAG